MATALVGAVTFGPDWIGDLSAFDGGTFSVDYIQTDQANGGYIESFGTLLLTVAVLMISADIIGPAPIVTEHRRQS